MKLLYRFTQQESICRRTNSVNYTDLSELETTQYNSLKSQILDIQFSAFKQVVTAVDQNTIRTTSGSSLLS